MRLEPISPITSATSQSCPSWTRRQPSKPNKLPSQTTPSVAKAMVTRVITLLRREPTQSALRIEHGTAKQNASNSTVNKSLLILKLLQIEVLSLNLSDQSALASSSLKKTVGWLSVLEKRHLWLAILRVFNRFKSILCFHIFVQLLARVTYAEGFNKAASPRVT